MSAALVGRLALVSRLQASAPRLTAQTRMALRGLLQPWLMRPYGTIAPRRTALHTGGHRGVLQVVSSARGYAAEASEETEIGEVTYGSADIMNSISLVGRLGKPIDVKTLHTGRRVADTTLAVKSNRTQETDWFDLEMWNQVAESASQTFDKGNWIHVAGQLRFDKWKDRETGMPRSKAKVVVSRVNRVIMEGDWSRQEVEAMDQPGGEMGGVYAQEYPSFTAEPASSRPVVYDEDKWNHFFQNRTDYYDNRATKTSPNSPDFRHKMSDVALWLDNRRTPPWVAAQLAKDPQYAEECFSLEQERHATSVMTSTTESSGAYGTMAMPAQAHAAGAAEEKWSHLFSNIEEYFDNRTNKRNPRAPDFKHRSSGQALWVDSRETPDWVYARLEQLGPSVHTELGVPGSVPEDAAPWDDEVPSMAAVGSVPSGSAVDVKWQHFIGNPSEYYDNRFTKRNPKAPDFKHKSTGEALWLSSAPHWAKQEIEATAQFETPPEVRLF